MLVTGSLMAYSYVVETFIAWYSGNLFERYMELDQPAVRAEGAWLLADDRVQRR